VAGITAQAATGHSPGHYIYAIQSRDETLIIIGDLSHHDVLLLNGFARSSSSTMTLQRRLRPGSGFLLKSRRRGTPFLLAISHSQGLGICARMPTITPGSSLRWTWDRKVPRRKFRRGSMTPANFECYFSLPFGSNGTVSCAYDVVPRNM
jgi:hypothetical protein